MKKAPRETQTMRAGCSKAEPKIFAPPQTPFPGGTGRPKLNQLEMVTTFTHKPSLVRIDICTHTPIHKQTGRYDMNSHDFINYSPSDINRRINKYHQDTIDQQTHTLAQLIFELVMVRDGEWSLSDSNFTKDDISAAIEHLCTA